ncbi:MAG: hypothetical protein SFX73_04045 [Kofleriaceae bacterium]|nr:hypothetical protein [Kofleriaceae bacterium]
MRRTKLDLEKLRMQRRMLVERIAKLRKEREARRAQPPAAPQRATKIAVIGRGRLMRMAEQFEQDGAHGSGP